MNAPSRFFSRLSIVTDESKEYFWLAITVKDTLNFAQVSASLQRDSLLIDAANCETVVICLDKMAQGTGFSRFLGKGGARVLLRKGETVMPLETALGRGRVVR
jgi:hypothetical protein